MFAIKLRCAAVVEKMQQFHIVHERLPRRCRVLFLKPAAAKCRFTKLLLMVRGRCPSRPQSGPVDGGAVAAVAAVAAAADADAHAVEDTPATATAAATRVAAAGGGGGGGGVSKELTVGCLRRSEVSDAAGAAQAAAEGEVVYQAEIVRILLTPNGRGVPRREVVVFAAPASMDRLATVGGRRSTGVSAGAGVGAADADADADADGANDAADADGAANDGGGGALRDTKNCATVDWCAATRGGAAALCGTADAIAIADVVLGTTSTG